jgi:hypothetical protein
MILYHGSGVVVEKPDLSFSREKTDFGKGFYLTPLKEQAVRWAERFKDEGGKGIVSSYSFLEKISEKLPDDIRILEFDTHSLEWLSFITDCRLGKKVHDEYDLIIGGVANDKVIQTLQLYFRDVITAEDAIGRLRYNKPNHQYCFKNQSLMDEYLQFIEAREL